MKISMTYPTRSNSYPFSKSLRKRRIRVAAVLMERGINSNIAFPWYFAVRIREVRVKAKAKMLKMNIIHYLYFGVFTLRYRCSHRNPRKKFPFSKILLIL